MPERNTAILAGLGVLAATAAAALCFMFAGIVAADHAEQLIETWEAEIEELGTRKAARESELEEKTSAVAEKEASLKDKESDVQEKKGWRESVLREAQDAARKIQPAVEELRTAEKSRFDEMANLERAMKEARGALEADQRNLNEAIRLATERLHTAVRQFEEREKGINTDIAQLKARLLEVRDRLKRVQVQALRGKMISDVGGKIIEVGGEGTNYVVIGIGAADRVRKGLKFEVWTLKRGYGRAWVRVPGRDFVEEGVLPGDWLLVGTGEDARRYPIMSVGISKDAEQAGVGLARNVAADTFKITGPGVTEAFSVTGLEWRMERASAAEVAVEDLGVLPKGTIEVFKVHRHTSEAVILPERWRLPVCSQCGWEAPDQKMRHCPFCFLGENNDEVQALEATRKELISRAEDPFKPIAVGDSLSNPYFSPTSPLIFAIAGEPVSRNRQELVAFIEEHGGRVVSSDVLVRPPGLVAVTGAALPIEINYLVVGTGEEAERLLKRARDLGIRVMRDEELYEFFGRAGD